MADTTKVYAGRIIERDHGESLDLIFLGDDDEPLTELVEEDLDRFGKNVSVSYFVADEPRTKEQLEDALIRQLVGDLEAEYHIAYSEITGYLWTDEELQIGGHDLLQEIRSSVGSYLHLEITYHGAQAGQ